MEESAVFRNAINGFNKTDVLDYVKDILEKNTRLTAENEALRKELEEQKTLAEENARGKAPEQHSETDIEKLSEQKLGKVMYDARRFSDLIVSEANEKADSIFANASRSSEKMLEQVNSLKSEADEFSAAFFAGLKSISERLDALGASLTDFSAKTEDEKSGFIKRINSDQSFTFD